MGTEFLFCKIEKFWGWFHNNVNVFNPTKLYTQKWLGSEIYVMHILLQFKKTRWESSNGL